VDTEITESWLRLNSRAARQAAELEDEDEIEDEYE
jgi:hypothetical protein